MHVDTNPAWVCAEIANLKQQENGCNAPEKKVDQTCNTPGVDEGELWNNLLFTAWRDKDCDNTYDDGEDTYVVQNAKATNIKWAIADASTGTGAIEDACIAVAWNVPADVGNIIQGDSVSANIEFKAYQQRNNDSFLCNPPTNGTITVIKQITNDDGGNNVIGDFQLYVGGTPVISGQTNSFPAGSYTVTGTGISGYKAEFSLDCTNGSIALAAGENKICTLNNNDIKPNITLIKNVVGGGPLGASQFPMYVDGILVQNNSSISVSSNTPHVITETQQTGYHFTSITGSAKCPTNLGDTATLNEGEAITCTITNSYYLAP